MALTLKNAAELLAIDKAPGADGVVVPPELQEKILAIMGEVDSIPKNGYNERQNYKYVMAADVVDGVRRALVKHRVIISPGFPRLSPIGHTEKMAVIETLIPYTITDVDSGASVTIVWRGWGADAGDKAPYKAFTGSLKYFLLNFFMLPTDPSADPEHEPGRPAGGSSRGTSQQPPRSGGWSGRPPQQRRQESSAPAQSAPPKATPGPLGLASMKARKGSSERPTKCAFCNGHHIVAGDQIVKRPSDNAWGSFACYRPAGDGDPATEEQKRQADQDDLPFDRAGGGQTPDAAGPVNAEDVTEGWRGFDQGRYPVDWDRFLPKLHPADVFGFIDTLEETLFGDLVGASNRDQVKFEIESFRFKTLDAGEIPDDLSVAADQARRKYLQALLDRRELTRRTM